MTFKLDTQKHAGINLANELVEVDHLSQSRVYEDLRSYKLNLGT